MNVMILNSAEGRHPNLKVSKILSLHDLMLCLVKKTKQKQQQQIKTVLPVSAWTFVKRAEHIQHLALGPYTVGG